MSLSLGAVAPLPSNTDNQRPTPAGAFCFAVQAAAEPGAMPRVLELFAKRGLVPSRWVSRTQGPGDRELSIDIQMVGLDRDTGAYVARCLRQLPDVRAVLTSEKPG